MPELYKNKNTAFYRQNQVFEYNFKAKEISSDGGILLTKKIVQNSGLIKSFASLIPDNRASGLIDYSIEKLTTQRVLMAMQGYEDCNDEEKLQNDPVMQKVLGKRLASQPTLSRFENNISKSDIYRLCEWWIDQWVESLSFWSKEVIIDTDGTDDPTHGQQQLSCFSGYYYENMYMQVYFKDGISGQVILPLLLPGYYSSSRLYVAVLKRIIKKIRAKFPNKKIILRADSAYPKPELFQLAEEDGNVYYAIGLTSNSVLKKETASTEEFIRRFFMDHGLKIKCVSKPFQYKAATWHKEQTVYAKYETMGNKLSIRYFVSNFDTEAMTGNEIYWDFYTQRGDKSENRIKELKNMCYADRLSCNSFWANFFRLMIYTLEYEVFRLIKILISKTKFSEAKHWLIDNIRLNLLKIGTTINETIKRVKIHFSKAFRYQDLLHSLIQLA